jgi:Mg2+-importing ATPase
MPFVKSRPSLPMLFVPTGAALVGAILPYTGLAKLLGFTPLPTTFFLLLFGMVVVYLLLVELAKTRFYRAPHARTPRIASSHAERLERRIRRRAHRFITFAMQEEQTRRGSKAQASRTRTVNKPSDE